MSLKHAAIDLTLRGLGGARRLAPDWMRGLGAILMFHHVRPWRARAAAPNRELEITPEFLDETLQLLKRRGVAIVTLDAAVERLAAAARGEPAGDPFVALTFDDGYRDNLEWALPILKRERAPMTLFVTTGFAAREAGLWWVEAEEALLRAGSLDVTLAGRRLTLPTANAAQKATAGARLMAALRALPQDDVDEAVAGLAREHGVDGRALTGELCLDWAELTQIAAEPLVTIGAHTRTHPMLATLDEGRARSEIADARIEIEARLGRPVRHLAYPVGSPAAAGTREFRLAREAGYASAVTTRPGMLFAEHAGHLHALPRLSINGRHQSLEAVDALLTGAPFLMWNRGRRANVA